ncbi:MAG TPA: energy transducer TonB [Vicinamibacterales bacterium]|nr:energy transducer TonB [Vicinamibacterales bacterium]
MNRSLLKAPSAFLPLLMSLTTILMVWGYLGYAALAGISHEPAADEGPLAHLFQLLMAGQVPLVAFFAVKGLPRAPKQAAGILALQIASAFVAAAPVLFLVQDAYEPGRDVSAPVAIRQVKAEYTDSAKAARIEGDVLMWAVVRPDGTVGDVVVRTSIDPTHGLDRKAVAALKQWQFKPGTKAGTPVPVRISVRTTFALDQ